MNDNIPLAFILELELLEAERVDTGLLDPCRLFIAGLADELRHRGHTDIADRMVALVERSRAASRAAGDARQIGG
ncbi:hypothetical protein [Halochromatium roseum]|uniref:hypothetical protein n=1 Tax=Halochromatium roseum TaxID=391920 RepID=UPI0019123989|nr:hypothetical protein [Halochromatium roseum]MBK5938121.1 hypothetical protein [Halochromatium roseum]